jgi:hypothetical protein
MKDVLKNREWKGFLFQEIFIIERGTQGVYKKDLHRGIYPYISASANNNGISDSTNEFNRNKNLISLAYDGSTGSAFYQSSKWFASEKIVSLDLKKYQLNKYIALFIIRCIEIQKEKFSYGYKWSVGRRMNKTKILLPVDSEGQPDYAFMEEYMRNLERKKIAEYQAFIAKVGGGKTLIISKLQIKKWRECALTDIFMMIQRGKRLKTGNHIKGWVPYVSSTGTNNGVDGFVGNKDNVRIFNNCLTIANSGSVGATFYHPFQFIASDHVTKLSNNEFNKYVYLFISMLVSRLGEKYSFNREINDDRIRKEKIMLPVNAQNEPDYEYMEQFMRKKEQEKLMQYLEYIDKRI